MFSSFRVCPIEWRALPFFFAVLAIDGLYLPDGWSGTSAAVQQRSSDSISPERNGIATKHHVTPEDGVRMVRIAGHDALGSYGGTLTKDFAYFSPDGKRFAIILKKGDLETNTNEYSLLLFETEKVFLGAKPKTLIRMSSSSNREGINDLAWLSDNDTILFLGEMAGEETQLYSVSSSSGKVQRLTNHETSLVAFSADADGRRIAYAAERPSRAVVNAQSVREGVVVADEAMSQLLGGSILDEERELIILDRASGTSRALPIGPELHGKVWGGNVRLSLSPNGRWLAVKTNLTEVPPEWWQYREPLLKRNVHREIHPGSLSWIYRYALIETETGRGRVLLDSPVMSGSEVGWSPDGRSVVLTGVTLPIYDNRLSPDLRGSPAAVEVMLENLSSQILSGEDLHFIRWDQPENVLVLERRQSKPEKPQERKYFQKHGDRWDLVAPEIEETRPLDVGVVQDLNTPPQVVATDRRTNRRRVILDLNPQFRELQFGRVQEVQFLGAEGLTVRAGLYFPPDYVAGRKYPLVVQTHGFEPNSFWIDGPFATAFAARALCAHGMLVLQLPDRHDETLETPNEAPRMMETIENAIAYVESLGILDRARVGIVGFSRTGLYVFYMLTHSQVHFGAVVIADGSDGGYSQYLQFLDAHAYTAADSESINGGPPFGPDLLYWLRRSPEFLLDTINAPVMIQAVSHDSLSMLWGEFKGLRRLGKPVELIYFPTGAHILQKPWDRVTSQQGTVDWCAFWLTGEEDSDPSKAEKYARWRALRTSPVAPNRNMASSSTVTPENR